MYEKTLREIPLFESVEYSFFRAFAKNLQERYFQKGYMIMRANEVISNMYIIYRGKVRIKYHFCFYLPIYLNREFIPWPKLFGRVQLVHRTSNISSNYRVSKYRGLGAIRIFNFNNYRRHSYILQCIITYVLLCRTVILGLNPRFRLCNVKIPTFYIMIKNIM